MHLIKCILPFHTTNVVLVFLCLRYAFVVVGRGLDYNSHARNCSRVRSKQTPVEFLVPCNLKRHICINVIKNPQITINLSESRAILCLFFMRNIMHEIIECLESLKMLVIL